MATPKRAAIDFEKVSAQTLGEITAADFLSALDAGGLSVSTLTVWPEKKKVELWVEPEDYRRIRLGDVFVRIRNEKKKYEKELPFALPGGVYEELLGRLVQDIEARLGTRLGLR